MDAFYITTSIPYVNARPHVGFALELVQADVLARYYRLRGHRVRLQTGTDENAYKNVLSARARGEETPAWVERHAAIFRTLAVELQIAADDFVRTTEERHRRAVVALWERLRPGDLYRRSYVGLYCPGCEDFYRERDLVQGRCPDHGSEPVEVEEENVFFRLSAYQEDIEKLLESGRLKVAPQTRLREVQAFARRGLEDFSVSRSARRVEGWGIGVPGDADQTVYVWVDALINYLSGPGFGAGEAWRIWWGEGVRRVHVVGKNVWKFHAIYWPALLLSAGLEPPNAVAVHGFLTEEGRRISKTQGNGSDALDLVSHWGAEALRYYLLRAAPGLGDGDFSEQRLGQVYQADLAHGLGNVVARLTVLAEREGCAGVRGGAPAPPPGYAEAVENYAFDRALDSLWAVVTDLNRRIEAARPWERPGAVRQQVQSWLEALHGLAWWVRPFLPEAGKRVLAVLAQDRPTSLRDLYPKKNLRGGSA